MLLELDAATGIQRASSAISLAKLHRAYITDDATLTACFGRASDTFDRDDTYIFRHANERSLQLLYTLQSEECIGIGGPQSSVLVTAALPRSSAVSLRDMATGDLLVKLRFEENMHANVIRADEVWLSPDCVRLIMCTRVGGRFAIFEIKSCGSCNLAYVPHFNGKTDLI